MKRIFIIGILLLFKVLVLQAQWTGTNPITTNSNVGIGTTTPVGNLEVANSSGAVLSISTNKVNGYSTSPLKPRIDFLGYLNSYKARITATEESYNTNGSKFSILLNDGTNATNLVERFVILKNGNIGVGTTNPLSLFHVGDNSGSGIILNNRITNVASMTPAQIAWGESSFGQAGDLILAPRTDISSASLRFFTNNGSAISERFRINSNGNIGIGTTSPALAKLQIKSTIGTTFDALAFYTEDGTYNPRVIISHVTATNDHYLKFDSNYGSGSGYADFVFMNGNVGIGTTNPGNYKLNVTGRIRANEVVVNTSGADFVFHEDYILPDLSDVESFIRENKHLPDIAPASEMKVNGINVSEMQTKLLQKVEELTLYIIDQSKELNTLKKENEQLKNERNIQLVENQQMFSKLINEIELLKGKKK